MPLDAPAAAADSLPLAETTRLAVAARDGNAAAFETLMTRFTGVVYKIALGRCRDRTDAEDHSFGLNPRMARAFLSDRQHFSRKARWRGWRPYNSTTVCAAR